VSERLELDLLQWLHHCQLPFDAYANQLRHCVWGQHLRLHAHRLMRGRLFGNRLFCHVPGQHCVDDQLRLHNPQLRHPCRRNRLFYRQRLDHVWLYLLYGLRHRLHWHGGDSDLPKRWDVVRPIRLHHSQLRYPCRRNRLFYWQRVHHLWLNLFDDLRHRLFGNCCFAYLSIKRNLDCPKWLRHHFMRQSLESFWLRRWDWGHNLRFYALGHLRYWVLGHGLLDYVPKFGSMDYKQWLHYR